MENHGLETHNDIMCADTSTGNTTIYSTHCPNRPIIQDIFEKSSHHMSMMHTILLFCTSCNSIYFVQGHLTCHFSTITLISNPAVCTLYSFYYFLYLCTFQEFIRVSKDVIFFLFKKVCKGILAKKQDFAYLDLMQGPGK